MGNEGKVKIVIYVEIGLFILELICILLSILFAAALEDYILQNYVEPKDRSEMKSAMRTVFVVIFVIIAIVMLVGLILLIFLYKGHAQRSAGKLKVWFYVICVGTGLSILGVASAVGKNPSTFVSQIPTILYVVYRVWALVVVKGFINEIQEGPQQPPFQGVAYANA